MDQQLCTDRSGRSNTPTPATTQTISQFLEAPHCLTVPSTPKPPPSTTLVGTREFCGPFVTAGGAVHLAGQLCLDSGGPSSVRILELGGILRVQGNHVMFLWSKLSKSQKHSSHVIFWKPVGLKLAHLCTYIWCFIFMQNTCMFFSGFFLWFFFMSSYFWWLFFKIWNTSHMCMSSLSRNHANLLCIIPLLVYVLPKPMLLLMTFRPILLKHAFDSQMPLLLLV